MPSLGVALVSSLSAALAKLNLLRTWQAAVLRMPWCAIAHLRRLKVNPALSDVWTHMRDLGLGALAHANRHAAYAAMENKRWPELSVLQAAHAAELLIKARIAEEHPLLVFEKLPRSIKSAGQMLDVQDLFRYGRTLQWPDLRTPPLEGLCPGCSC